MAQYNGQLKTNEIFSAIYNMIISQQVFADNIKGVFGDLANRFRVDGSLYGDTKLFYSSDVLKSVQWGNDAEAENLLKIYRPKSPDVQAITLDQFRQICLTVDNYLSKRAFSTMTAFSDFNNVMLGWIRDTKRVYDATLVNSYTGTVESNEGKQQQLITLPTNTNKETENRLQAQTIAEKLANLIGVELQDVSRDFNDYANLRSLAKSDILVVWNSEFYNKILKIDLPTIYHKNELMGDYEKNILPARYFGKVNAEGGTTGGANVSIRSLVEKDFTDGTEQITVHCFPGDLLPANATYLGNETYTEDHTIICKIMHKNSIPFMSAFEVGTSFFNSKALTDTHYLTWGYNTLDYLKNYPMVTVRGQVAGKK